MSCCFSSQVFDNDSISRIIFTIFVTLITVIALTMKVMYNHNQVINEFEVKIDELLTKIGDTYTEMIVNQVRVTDEREQ
jgi:hypothetical protein